MIFYDGIVLLVVLGWRRGQSSASEDQVKALGASCCMFCNAILLREWMEIHDIQIQHSNVFVQKSEKKKKERNEKGCQKLGFFSS